MSLFDSYDPEPTRVIGWFSNGSTSTVACKLILAEYPDAEIVNIRIASEHPDAERYANDCEKWFGKKIIKLVPPDVDHFNVIQRTRYIAGVGGARCTTELKIKMRAEYQRSGDLHIFGFDIGELERVQEFADNNPSLWFRTPLIEAGLSKSDCKNIVERAGIELHAMYRLGYDNANCVGCVKGGMGYWNRIRVDFPEVFARMSQLESSIGGTVLRHRKGPLKGERLPLSQLDPTAGRFEEDQPSECGVLCQTALEKVGLS